MNELILIKYLLSKDLYEKYHKYISLDYLKANYPEIYKIYLILGDAHKKDIHLESIDDLKALFFSGYSGLRKKEVEAYELLFNRLREVLLSSAVLETVLEAHRRRSIAFDVASLGFAISEGKKDFSELPVALERLKEESFDISDEEEEPFVTDSLEDLYQQTYAKPGYKWKLNTLNKMMGGLRKGDMGFVFARPEVGKTTFLADQGAYFASQLEGPLLHFNNEEFGPKVKLRYYQAALGVTTKELATDRDKYEALFREKTNGKIKIYDAASISKQQVERVCEKYSPSLIIFDSIDKLKGFEDDRDDLVYKQIYAWARELAKTYGPVIGVCHAAVSAERKMWLTMDDVAYAKTAKQGEADWILGIGATYEQGQEHIRYLHLPKNKLMGSETSDESLRHGKLPVLIHPDIAQYEDMATFDD